MTSDMGSLFGGTYSGRRVLVTGHTGFKGSWLVTWLQAMGAQVSAFSLAADTTPNHYRLLNPSLYERAIDVRSARAVRAAFQEFQPEIVFHLAAQALVRQSYVDPVETFDVNIMGLVNVLEAIRVTPSVLAVVSVTSDKCYRQRNTKTPFAENDPLGGCDPYSASKACAEIISESYRASFLFSRDAAPVAMATARAGNVVGGGDWSADRLIPDLVRAASAKSVVSIRNPNSVRPWQHVLEPLSGYLLLGQHLLQTTDVDTRSINAWNFGPDADGHLTVAEVIDGFAKHWSDVRSEVDNSPHPHEAPLLFLNCDKSREQLLWRPVWNADVMLERTANWYRAWYDSSTVRTASDLSDYVHDARNANIAWAA
ncbi:MAG: CDP-glucose 4,6-dehydratase [Gemmatimonadaceae bacterium]